MSANDQSEPPRRLEQIAAFRRELAELEREHVLILTPEQRAQVAAHQDRLLAAGGAASAQAAAEAAKRISWGMRIVTLLGSAAFFAALVLFLHRVWGSVPIAAQVAILTGLPLGLLGAVEWSYRRHGSTYYVGVLGLATGVAFFMGLSTLGTILNLTPSPHALAGWAAFAILLAYAYDLRLMLAIGLTLACAYAGALGAMGQGRHWSEFFAHPAWLLPAAVMLYALPGFVRQGGYRGFEFVYRACGAAIGLLALLILSESPDPWCTPPLATMAEALYQLAGLAVCSGVVGHGLRLGSSGLVNLGAAAFVVFLFVRLHGWWWNLMPKYLFFLCLGLIALGLLAGFRRLRRRLPVGGLA